MHLSGSLTAVSRTSWHHRSGARERYDSARKTIGDEMGGGGRQVAHEACLGAAGVLKHVVVDEQINRRIALTFLADRHGCQVILALRAFLDHVVAQEQRATIGQVDRKAGRPGWAVLDRGADNLGTLRARFDVMTHILLQENRIGDLQQSDRADIDAVGAVGIAFAVPREDAAADENAALRADARQYAILVIGEAATVYREIGTLGADSGAVLVARPRVCEFDAADRDIGAGGHEDPLVLADLVADYDDALPFDDEIVGAPHRAIDIFPGVDAHDVAALGDRRGGARQLHR